MKKLLFTLIAFATFGTVQSQVIFYEDFDGIPGSTSGGPGTYSFPTGWFLRNVDNLTPDPSVSYVNESWIRREDFHFNISDSVALSTSYYSPAGTSDDWMWTPLIGTLPANSVLSWNAVTYDGSYPDGYEVRIMIAPNIPGGGTGVIGNQVTSSTILFSSSGENTNWISRSVNLNAYTGQSVYIGFRNNSTDKFVLLIDDIKVEVPLNYDAKVISFDPITEYSMTPLSQVTPLNFSAKISNNGSNDLTNVKLNVEVMNSSKVIVYSASGAPQLLSSGDTSNFTIAPYTPIAADSFTVRYHVSEAETDQLYANDTLYGSFVISDSIYARDRGVVDGHLGIGSHNGGFLGQTFEIKNAADLTSVTMYFTLGYTGRKCAAVIWDLVGGVPNAIIAGTDTILYPDNAARFYTLGIHGGYINLAPGSYAITAVEFDTTLSIGLTSEIFTPGTTWVNWPTNPFGVWSHNEDFGAAYSKSYILRPNFGIVCHIVSTIASSTDPTCNGSNNGSISVSSNGGKAPLTYNWTSNVSTTSTASNLDGGSYSIIVTDANGCPSNLSITLTEPSAIDVTTSTNGNVITANASSATYQWLDCNNGYAMINNATNKSFSVSSSGNFAVVVSENSCSDTSACVNVILSGIAQQMTLEEGMYVYPNPSSGSFIIQASKEGTYSIYNDLGQLVKTFKLNAQDNYSIVIDDDFKNGVYLISGVSENKVVRQKMIVNK